MAARFPFRTIASESWQTELGDLGSFFKLEYNMVLFTFKPLGEEAAAALQGALGRWIRVHEIISGERFYGKGGRFTYGTPAVEVDEIVEPFERDQPYWHVTVREETNRNGAVDVQRLVTYNLRPRRRKGKTHFQQVSEWVDKLRGVP